ncbi:RNA 2'-phosphotransferase [Bacillus sp. Bva_UNVM-123]|uniref:RNA 2'-phosphotransferase n=1 Tax=Bacillus sp. Bva_UNVM-123 TaxID=2829798 RepID=UPI00391F5238
MDYFKLSKEISYALRHAPWEYELELDDEGWVDIEQLLITFRINNQWKHLDVNDMVKMVEISDKKRHEISKGKIRALYGHSITQKIKKRTGTPSSIIYHGTARHLVEQILNQGLQPMSRQFVHLSADTDTAFLVGKRKDFSPVILRIDAEKALDEGIRFYKGNNTIWLADFIPSEYISIE